MGIFDDLNDDLNGGEVDRNAEIRKAAHVVNGGEAMFPCPSCGGSGLWRGRGSCFKCKGTGNVSKRVLGAAKAKVTRRNNFIDWCEANADLIAGMRRHSWNNFLVKLLAQIDEDQRPLSENQAAAAQRTVADADKRDAERARQRAEEREKSAKDVGVDAINKLFETALENGLKKPQFRTENLTIKLAKLHADTLYVTRKDEYMGKIVSGKFYAVRSAPADVYENLVEIAKDPKGAAVAYGRSTGICCCCGRELTDPVSVESGIGPICESKWGL